MWMLVVGFSLWAVVSVYEVCFKLRGRAQTNRARGDASLGSNVLCLHVPPQIDHAATGSLQGLNIQLSVLDHEFQDLGMGICSLLG